MSTQQATLESAARAVFIATKTFLGQEAMLSSAIIIGGAALWRLTNHRATTVSNNVSANIRTYQYLRIIVTWLTFAGCGHMACWEDDTE